MYREESCEKLGATRELNTEGETERDFEYLSSKMLLRILDVLYHIQALILQTVAVLDG